MQTCNECKETKPWDEFHKDSTRKTGHRLTCKPCVKAYNAKRYQRERERLLAWRHEYYTKNREATLETNRLWRERNADEIREKRRAASPAQRERKRVAHNLWRYGLNQAQYDALLESQGGTCGMCDATERLHVDHDHSCCPNNRSCGKCVRGILCMNCNPLLGQAKDSIERLAAGIRYLEQWQARGVT